MASQNHKNQKKHRKHSAPASNSKLDPKLADKLVNTKVNINDGWADDVHLLYPEESWKPEDYDLTKVDIEPDEPPSKAKDKKATKKNDNSQILSKEEQLKADEEKKQEELKQIIKEDSTHNKRRIHPFRLFMILWIGTLIIAIAIGLNYFYKYLEDYEAEYQASRPFHTMDDLMVTFDTMDVNTIINLMTVTADINEFETTDNLNSYILSLLSGKEIAYTPTANYSEDFPEYYITADGYIVAMLQLKKEPLSVNTENASRFPKWYISSFEFYTDAQYSVRVEKPTNYTLCINGIVVDDSYRYEGNIDIGDKQDYFGSNAIIPQLEKYYVNGFYEKPYITAISCFGTECEVVWNESRGIYEVPLAGPDNYDELEEFVIQAACDYTNWVSKDADEDIINQYFEEDSELLKMIKAGTSRKYFTTHSNTNIQNIQVLEFTVYTPKAMYASISLDQHMTVWGEDTIVPVQCNFYYVNTDAGWKIVSIMF